MFQETTLNKIFTDLPEDKETYFKEICEKYPYFSLAHFYNLKYCNNSSKQAKLDMTMLHFDNPYLLNHRLKEIKSNTSNIEQKEEIKEDLSLINFEPVNKEEKEIEGLGTIAAEIKSNLDQPVSEKELEIAFEPLHTTDYFASQGIKISEEIKSDDKLGKQLRSFTDWLKTMKKVETVPNSDPSIDISIQKIAENSNKDEEIITESMAEVYITQGKYKKASGIYKKLSLLFPDKSAYFAAKLESLKDK